MAFFQLRGNALSEATPSGQKQRTTRRAKATMIKPPQMPRGSLGVLRTADRTGLDSFGETACHFGELTT